MQLRDGSLLGSTAEGGLSRRGTIFRSTTGGASQPVHMFGGTDPLTPYAGMIAGPDGALYGSSCFGGTFNAGTLFKLTSAGTVLTVLHSFAYWDGMCPTGSLAFGADGALYGSAALHGLGGGGTIFRLPPTGPLSVLRFFALEDFANGWNPTGVVLASDGNLYGTTRGSFLRWGGTAFRLSAAGLTTLHTFLPGTFNAPTETSPASLFQASDGHLYGATMQGPFRMTLAGEVTPLGDLGVMTRAFTQGTDGALYSATAAYPTEGGTLFRMTQDGSINVLHSHTDGSQRYFSGLLPAPDGTFYGGIAGRERGDPSSLFQLLGAGAPITIHTFSGPDGAHPAAPLTLGPDGAIYGTTVYGGASDRGVIFRFRR